MEIAICSLQSAILNLQSSTVIESASSKLEILLVGNIERREFGEARASLEAGGRLTTAADVEAAARLLTNQQSAPDVIVVAQAFPGQFSAEAIDRLRVLAPLARVIGLMGSWCEGEMRTGKPWPAAVRVYWHQWPARCAQELCRLAEGFCSTWGLPATASEEERFLSMADGSIRPSGLRGLVAIHTPWFDMYEWLSAACRCRGYSTVWLRDDRAHGVAGVQAGIFDATECRADEAASLARLAAAIRPAPVVALLDFPRVDDCDRALRAGAAAVLSKPLLIDDLYWQLP